MDHHQDHPEQNHDSLHLRSLSLPTGLVAPYTFPGSSKLQPATLTLTLNLDRGFSSAAQSDALDQNTIHYGNLAKAVREWKSDGGDGVRECVDHVESVVDRLARRGNGTSRVRRSQVDVELPKASAQGERCVVSSVGEGGERKVSWRVESVRVMCLIGVNAVERTGKQALELDLEVRGSGDGVLGREKEVFGLEGRMVEVGPLFLPSLRWDYDDGYLLRSWSRRRS